MRNIGIVLHFTLQLVTFFKTKSDLLRLCLELSQLIATTRQTDLKNVTKTSQNELQEAKYTKALTQYAFQHDQCFLRQ